MRGPDDPGARAGHGVLLEQLQLQVGRKGLAAAASQSVLQVRKDGGATAGQPGGPQELHPVELVEVEDQEREREWCGSEGIFWSAKVRGNGGETSPKGTTVEGCQAKGAETLCTAWFPEKVARRR